MVAEGQGMHLAHFNWATLIDVVGSPRVAGFVNAVDKVNALAERADGFVWRSGDEGAKAQAIGWPLFDDPRVIASFSVWQNPEALKDYVYKTVHGAFFRRREEWFAPGQGPNYVLWWVPEATIPTMQDARTRVEAILVDGPGPQAFDFGWLAQQAAAQSPA